MSRQEHNPLALQGPGGGSGCSSGSDLMEPEPRLTRKKTEKKKRTIHHSASLVVQRVKRLPAMQETWVRPLGQEDPLEKEMATHSSTLAWKIPWTEKPGRLQFMELQRVRHN